MGGTGNDTYIFGRGYGRDTIFEEDSTIDVTDQVTFLPDINPDQIWFQHVGNNLEVSIIGTSDKLIIKDWYLDSKHRIDQFKTADDAMLQDHEIESLVAAMAPLTKPGTGQTDLPASYEPILDPLISALWLA
ncbi:MAG: hypothetical protein KF839_06610 [Nitrosomonas sp.]|nr:hypothetical protein [Nitrosomonas sp.]